MTGSATRSTALVGVESRLLAAKSCTLRVPRRVRFPAPTATHKPNDGDRFARGRAINYAVALPIPTLPGLVVPRNAVGVMASVGGDTFRFVSTHVEPLVPGVPDDSQPQLAQVGELVELLATEHEPGLPTVVVGDFNSPAETGASYQIMANSGYTDVWTHWSFTSWLCSTQRCRVV